MKYIKARYLKNDVAQGRAYTFKTKLDLSAGDRVDLGGKVGIVVDESVDMAWVEAYGADKVKEISKKVDQEESED